MISEIIKNLEEIDWRKLSLARESLTEFIDKDKLLEKLKKVNPQVPSDYIKRAANQLLDSSFSSLFQLNQKVFKVISQGEDYGRYKVNFLFSEAENYSKNDFNYLADLEVRPVGRSHVFRLELVLFVNYLPLIVFTSQNEKQKCFDKAKEQAENLFQLYKYNFLNLLVTANQHYLGVLGDEIFNYLSWQPRIVELLSPSNLLNVYFHYTAFRLGDRKKILTRYYQYYCAEKILHTIDQQKDQEKKGGIIWHTTGSGKSLTMIFTAGKILQKYPYSTILLITDRIQLNEQLKNFFSEFPSLIPHDNLISAKNRSELLKILRGENRGNLIFANLHKFSNSTDQVFNNPDGVFLFIDEAHRSQNLKNQTNLFSYAQVIRKTIPNGYYFAWTGTPIETKNKSTYQDFGEIIHRYSTQEARDDKIIVDQITYDYFPLQNPPGTSARQAEIITKIKTDYQQLAQRFSHPKILLMVTSQDEARQLFEAFHKEKDYKENVCLIISDFEKTAENIRKFKLNNIPHIAIVVDMLTTGFDLPTLQLIYLDKNIESPSDLWQRISRVNRRTINKKVGRIIDFYGNEKTLAEAKEKYFSSESIGISSTRERVQTNLLVLRKILADFPNHSQLEQTEFSEQELLVGYLNKERKEKKFLSLVQEISEIIMYPEEIGSQEDIIFFTNCQKISVTINLPKQKNNSPNQASSNNYKTGTGKMGTKNIYDEYYYLHVRLQELIKLRDDLEALGFSLYIKEKILFNLDKLINEYEERNPANFNPLSFQSKIENTFRLATTKYQEFLTKKKKNPDYLLEIDLQNYFGSELGKEMLEFSELGKFLISHFKKIFKNNSSCFIRREFGDGTLDRLFDEIFFAFFNHNFFSSLSLKQKIRQNTINLIKEHFYATT